MTLLSGESSDVDKVRRDVASRRITVDANYVNSVLRASLELIFSVQTNT